MVGTADVDAGDIEAGEGGEFAALADAVLVEVAPDAQAVKLRVGTANLAVAVAVEVAQGVEAIHCFLAVALERTVAEEFFAIVDEAVAVAVENQKAVVRFDPTGALLHPGAGLVEQDTGSGAYGFEAVAVEV